MKSSLAAGLSYGAEFTLHSHPNTLKMRALLELTCFLYNRNTWSMTCWRNLGMKAAAYETYISQILLTLYEFEIAGWQFEPRVHIFYVLCSQLDYI